MKRLASTVQERTHSIGARSISGDSRNSTEGWKRSWKFGTKSTARSRNDTAGNRVWPTPASSAFLHQGETECHPLLLQGALERVRQRVNAARYATLLEIHSTLAVDVQIAGKLYEDAPQEIRSRLWAALIQNPSLGPISTAPIVDVSALSEET